MCFQGAPIPRCPNGTNMVIPIPGPISDEDMGLKTRSNAPKNNLPFLYDFDGLEGELDFLTRVVVLTFYPAESTISPVTLGEVHSTLNIYVFALSIIFLVFCNFIWFVFLKFDHYFLMRLMNYSSYSSSCA